MADKVTNSNTNILPNNPMKAHNLLDHLKKVKGDMGWYEFNLKCLLAAYPDDKVFKDALATETKLAPAKETKASDATTGKGKGKKTQETIEPHEGERPGTKGNTKGKKTAIQLKAEKDKVRGVAGPITEQSPEETAGELANIK